MERIADWTEEMVASSRWKLGLSGVAALAPMARAADMQIEAIALHNLGVRIICTLR